MNNRNRVPGAPNLDPTDPHAMIPVPPAPVAAPVVPAPVVNAEAAEEQPQLSTKEILKQLAIAAGTLVYTAGVIVYRTATVGPDGTLWINLNGEQNGSNKFDGSFINPQSNPNANPYSNPYTSRQASSVAPTSTATSAAPTPRKTSA